MKKIFLFIILLLIFAQIFALKVPKLIGHINDYAGILSQQEKNTLESMLISAENKTSSQIVLLTIPSLKEESLEDFSMNVVETWKIGQKEFDNGILLLIAMKERKIRIEVGYGLEHIITDAKSGFIIRNLMLNDFRKGNFFGGISASIQAVSGLITKDFEITPEQLAKYKRQDQHGKPAQIPVGFIIFMIMILLSMFGKKGKGRRGGILPWLLLGSMLGGSGRGSSGFGGGFGGFSGGGGGFGGGGASGGW